MLYADPSGKVYSWSFNGSGELGNDTTNSAVSPVQVKGVDGQGFLTNVVAVSAGTQNSMALKSDGTVYAWGANQGGSLGIDVLPTSEYHTPMQVKGVGGLGVLTNIKAIDLEDDHALAISNDGRVYMWGFVPSYSGDGADWHNEPAPVRVKGVGGVGELTDIVAVAAGNNTFSLALKSNGTVYAWGVNQYGLGDGSIQSNYPVQVKGTNGLGFLTDIVAIAACADYYNTFSLALKSDGTVWAWGHNTNGQLGTNSYTDSLYPVQVTGVGGQGFLTGITAISAGNGGALALKNDGTVYAWGGGSVLLGNGLTAPSKSPKPLQVKGVNEQGFLNGIAGIAVGTYHALALGNNNTIYAWGSADPGVGDGTHLARYTPVVVISGLSSSSAQASSAQASSSLAFASTTQRLSGDDYHALYLKSGTVYAWGDNDKGQLGLGSLSYAEFPTPIGGLSNVISVCSGEDYGAALKSDGTVWAWGKNVVIGEEHTPVQMGSLSDVDAISCGTKFLLALKGNGTVAGVGDNTYNQTANLNTLSDIVAVSAGHSHGLALKRDGTVWGWGAISYGKWCNGGAAYTGTPTKVSSLSDVIGISAGSEHSLILKNDGSVWACGWNKDGELGNGTTTDSKIPVKVSSLTGVATIAAKGYHSLALKQDGTVWAWGDNVAGTIGNGTTTDAKTPVRAGNLTNVVAIANGGLFSLALKSDETLFAWGSADPIGKGRAAFALSPIQICTTCSATFSSSSAKNSSAAPSSAAHSSSTSLVHTRIASNYTHTIFLDTNGNVYTWGSNNNGQLGNGTTNDSIYPVKVKGVNGVGYLSGIKEVANGLSFSIALGTDGSVYAWGSNNVGTLGINDAALSFSNTPVKVLDVENGGELSDIKAITVGEDHVIALKTDGSVYAWGENYWRQLGNGTTKNSAYPVKVKGVNGVGYLSGIMAIAAGGSHTVALATDGSVFAWGRNLYGLGDGSSTDSALPVRVKGVGGAGFLSGIMALAAGGSHTVALATDGSVYIWGHNNNGQLGIGTKFSSPTPVKVKDLYGTGELSEIAAVSAGADHTLALRNDGAVYAWGSNGRGQLGIGTTSPSLIPVKVKNVGGKGDLSGISMIASGLSISLALHNNGELLAWGINFYGQLGDGTTTDRLTPVVVQFATLSSSSAAASSAPANDLLVVSQTGPASVAADGTATYTVTVRNEGSVTATNMVVTAAPPFQFTRENTTTSTCAMDTAKNVVRCSAVDLGAGQAKTYKFAYTVPAATACPKAGGAHIVLATTSATDPYRLNNRSVFKTRVSTCSGSPPVPSFPNADGADLWVQMLGPTLPVTRGSIITFPILLRNVGFDRAQSVQLQNPVPTNLVYNAAGSPTECSVNEGGTIVTCSVSPLDPLSAVSLSLRFTTSTEMSCSSFANTATAGTSTVDTDSTNDEDTYTCSIQCSSAASSVSSSGGASSIGTVTCSAAASSHATGATCTQFCPTGDSVSPNAGCTEICSYFPTSPSLTSVLCTPPQKVLSFSCEVYPSTPAQANYPRSYCTYVCGS